MRVFGDWLLTPARAAIHLPTATAVVADLHLGYAEARCQQGDALPRVPVAAALGYLRAAMATQGVRRLVVAGDLFEAGPSGAVVDELFAWLQREGVTLSAVVPGNHDSGIETEGRLPVQPSGFRLGAWQIVHGDGARPAGRVVQGHEHPLFRWTNGLSAPCYLVARNHLVLPAYSADAAGVNVLREDRWSRYRCCAIAGDEVLDFGVIANILPRPGAARRRSGEHTSPEVGRR